MKMKRVLSVVLIAAMAVLLTACGTAEPGPVPGPTSSNNGGGGFFGGETTEGREETGTAPTETQTLPPIETSPEETEAPEETSPEETSPEETTAGGQSPGDIFGTTEAPGEESTEAPTEAAFTSFTAMAAVKTSVFPEPNVEHTADEILAAGDIVTVTGESGDYYCIGTDQWVFKDCLYNKDQTGPLNPSPFAIGQLIYNTKCYAEPSYDSDVVTTLPAQEGRELYGRVGNWYQLSTPEGYVFVDTWSVAVKELIDREPIGTVIFTAELFPYGGPGDNYDFLHWTVAADGTHNWVRYAEGTMAYVYEWNGAWALVEDMDDYEIFWVRANGLYQIDADHEENSHKIGTGTITRDCTYYGIPGTSGDVLGQISAGTERNIYGQIGNWYQISMDNQMGWVHVGDIYLTAMEDTHKIHTWTLKRGYGLFAGPGYDYEILQVLNDETEVNIYREYADWALLYRKGRFVWAPVYDRSLPGVDWDEVKESLAEAETETAAQSTPYSYYILPDADSKELSRSTLERYSDRDLRLARNEIFAREGRKFNDADLQAYFDGMDWYEGKYAPADFDAKMNSYLNSYEQKNLATILAIEDARGKADSKNGHPDMIAMENEILAHYSEEHAHEGYFWLSAREDSSGTYKYTLYNTQPDGDELPVSTITVTVSSGEVKDDFWGYTWKLSKLPPK